jgi:hypothetical protein
VSPALWSGALGTLPSFMQLVAIEEPDNRAHKEQHGFVNGSRHRQESESAAPPNGPWDAAVANEECYGSYRPGDEGAHAPHEVSLERRSARLRLGTKRAPIRCNGTGSSQGFVPPRR